MGFDLTMRAVPERLPAGFPVQFERHPECYQMSTSGMTLMVAVLRDLGVLTDQSAPELPAWPPQGLTEERGEAIHNGGDATEAERAAYDAWKRGHEAAAATRSSVGVPTFKFASNDGWIVVPEECRLIAAALRACHFDAAFTARVAELSAGIDAAVRDALVAMGHEPPPRAAFSMTTSELESWFTEWAAWNEVAASAGGYTVT